MGTSGKILIGGLVVVNLALVGLLLFRDSSVARARAQADAALVPPVTAPVVAERQGGTQFTAAYPQVQIPAQAAPTGASHDTVRKKTENGSASRSQRSPKASTPASWKRR